MEHSVITPRRSRFARTIAKVLHVRAEKRNLHEKTKKGQAKNVDEDDKLLKEAFLAKLFASLSTVKAAYAQLQFSQSPYDADGIQTADQIIVSEIKNLSELKQCYVKKELDEMSPETTLLLSEIQEQRSLLRTYEITTKKLDYELKLKDSEITFLKEKLAEANSENKLLERRLNSSGNLAVPDDTRLSSLRLSHFVAYSRLAIKSVRSFVRLLITEMELADWDLEAAACSIHPGVSFWKPNHICFAFESFVCREMFDGFDRPNFSTKAELLPENKKSSLLYYERFMEMKSVRPADYLAWKPKSMFAEFCRKKYSRLVHPKMESSLFGNLNQRNLVNSGEIPDTPFFLAFSEMAKRVWLLHCLGFSFDLEVDIFQVRKGSHFSEVYMESLNEEAFFSSEAGSDPRVAFMVVPGFRIGKIIVQSQVYLC
ncbi:hypothetical protein CDL12_11404 [Handroanthus impetiginosus]|uniref:Uncharacterized protein n=1 Tax=Handroanthus impetiginosus TaxID=429701 RepID=A0A2G9HEJ8_9LAMI|nr:hypothetical protein CDL12_11404 [Handroanthus impetiginosus]